MLIQLRVSGALDGTTILSTSNAKLSQVGTSSTFWKITQLDGTTSLVNAGRIPMSFLVNAIQSTMGRMLVASHRGGGTSFTARIGVADGGGLAVMSSVRTVDPSSGDAHIAALNIPGSDYELVFTSNFVGGQTVYFEVAPILDEAEFAALDGFEGDAPLVADSLEWSSYVAQAALANPIAAGIIARYDATGGTFTLDAPAPVANARFALKEIAANATAITIDGNGEDIEDPTTHLLGATASVGGAGVYVEYEYDADPVRPGWRIVS